MQAKEAQIEELLQEGKPWNVIAQTLHVSKRTIAKVSKTMNEPVSSPPPISEVFEMFRQNKSPMEVVQATKADPTKILEWFDAWIQMNKGKVFEKFEEGVSPIDIVIATNADPAIIREWLVEWIQMNKDWEEGRKYVKPEKAKANKKDGEEVKESEEKRAEYHKHYEREL